MMAVSSAWMSVQVGRCKTCRMTNRFRWHQESGMIRIRDEGMVAIQSGEIQRGNAWHRRWSRILDGGSADDDGERWTVPASVVASRGSCWTSLSRPTDGRRSSLKPILPAVLIWHLTGQILISTLLMLLLLLLLLLHSLGVSCCCGGLMKMTFFFAFDVVVVIGCCLHHSTWVFFLK